MKIREKNYKDLMKYLKKENKRIDNEQFRAVLYAMNLLSQPSCTKESCLKVVKQRYEKVGKKFIGDILQNMCFVSAAKKEVNKQFTREMVLMNAEFRNRVAREK